MNNVRTSYVELGSETYADVYAKTSVAIIGAMTLILAIAGFIAIAIMM